MRRHTFLIRNRLIFLSLYIIFLFSHDVLSQSTNQLTEVRPTKRFAVANGSSKFMIDLDFDQAFDVQIKSFNGIEGNDGFCRAYPSQITAELVWNHPLKSKDSENYDNLAYYKGYYFILDSVTFDLVAAKDLQNPAEYNIILSDIKNNVTADNEIEVPFLVIDSVEGILYIITSKVMVSYVIENLFNALKDQTAIPSVSTQVDNFKGYSLISDIEYYQSRLYISADNYTEVYQVDSKGQATPQKKLDNSFFNVTELSIIDVAIKGNYAFLLDSIHGVFVIDISNAGLTDNKADPFVYKSNLRSIDFEDALFIEVIGKSVQIIYLNDSMPLLKEYIIKGDPIITDLVLNLDSYLLELPQDSYSDDNFLYVLTSFLNLVVKHSVPGGLLSLDDEDYLSEYWPLQYVKAMVSIATNSSSTVTALQSGYITQHKFSKENPVFRCELGEATEGLFTYKLRAIQPNCASKALSASNDFDTVCIIEETLELLVTRTGTEIGNTTDSEMLVFYLMIGIAILGVIVVIFICLSRKYRNQYQLLEDQIKSQNDSTERSNQSGSNKQSRPNKNNKSPEKFGVKLELEPVVDSDKERNTIGVLGSISKDEIKPGPEFGDLKPLDIDEIYGSKKKPQDDSSF